MFCEFSDERLCGARSVTGTVGEVERLIPPSPWRGSRRIAVVGAEEVTESAER